ncbi:MAG TPA: type II toxin-antitoxin system VapC family toxin [Alphaproteobacteria bacterium]|nr:type II toxin-antitoxin system VapC family toxin [Alphaproteobacteria bacterium]
MRAIDASALLAFLLSERGHERVAGHLSEACMSTVNLSEVLGRFARAGRDIKAIVARLADTPIEWVPFSERHAAIAAALVPATQAAGLPLGDRACLALALERGIGALTADVAWKNLDLGIAIETIR